MNNRIVICHYCGNQAKLVDSSTVYNLRPGESYGMMWRCDPCDAHVGTHQNSGDAPLGRLANAELRGWKIRAHANFDPLWKRAKDKSQARYGAYRWLAAQMGIEVDDCHIGYFDVEQCKKVVEICTAHRHLLPGVPNPETKDNLAATGEELKREGMRRAAEVRPTLLDMAQRIAVHIARRNGGVCTSDDVRAEMKVQGLSYDELGNAAGSVFRTGDWRWTGQYVLSKAPSRHRAPIRRWALIP